MITLQSTAFSGSMVNQCCLLSSGVVYGDIGTSPLYVFASVFPEAPEDPEALVYGVSLILWTITAIVCIKYGLIVLRADDNGQGELSNRALPCRYACIAADTLLCMQSPIGQPHCPCVPGPLSYALQTVRNLLTL